MKNMAFKVIDRLFIVVYGVADPTNDEWDGYLAEVERHGIERTMQLIVSDGGAPTLLQRQRLNDRLAGRTVPVAVITPSATVRVMTAVRALSWFNRKIHAFPPSGLREAIAYLEIPASRTELIEKEVANLRLDLRDDSRATA